MKRTLLDLTQDVLSALSSDEVNSIGDSTESLQVATIIKNKYFDIINRVNLTKHDQLVQLDPSLDPTIPVIMYVPDGVAEIVWLKYFNTNLIDPGAVSSHGKHDTNTDIVNFVDGIPQHVPGYAYVTILPVGQFIDMVNSFNPNSPNVDQFTFTDQGNGFPGTYTFYYKNDRTPSFCTILNNYNVIFDSFDATQDSTLQTSKTMAWGRVIPTFKMEDSFIPDLDDESFTLLLNEAKALAYFELKQTIHPKAEQEIKRGWSTVQKNKSVANKPSAFNQLPNFGRHGYFQNNYAAGSEFKARGWDR